MHRARLSVRHFRKFGWNPVVLKVAAKYCARESEELLLETLPKGVSIHSVVAFPVRISELIGIRDLALRAYPFILFKGAQIIRRCEIDLVYFSTTLFYSMTLGRIWKSLFGTPFVIDMQDPWGTEYRSTRWEVPPDVKRKLARALHGALEPWTMRRVDGVVAVSEDYTRVLQKRYAWLSDKPSLVLPFGVDEKDFAVLRSQPQDNPFFNPRDGHVHGVYVGAAGPAMAHALKIVFSAFRKGLETNYDLFSRIRLHFIGTDYAPRSLTKKSVEPLAQELGLSAYVNEHTLRIPYFQSLQMLKDADFFVIPGSDDPQYTASKVFTYIMLRKPLLAVFHENSSVVDIIRSTGGGSIVTFDSISTPEAHLKETFRVWRGILERLPFSTTLDRHAFEPYTAFNTTKRQCELFDQILERRQAVEP